MDQKELLFKLKDFYRNLNFRLMQEILTKRTWNDFYEVLEYLYHEYKQDDNLSDDLLEQLLDNGLVLTSGIYKICNK